MTPPYISVEETARRTGLSKSELATLRWGRRHGEAHALRFVYFTGGKAAKPLYCAVSVAEFVERAAEAERAEADAEHAEAAV